MTWQGLKEANTSDQASKEEGMYVLSRIFFVEGKFGEFVVKQACLDRG